MNRLTRLSAVAAAVFSLAVVAPAAYAQAGDYKVGLVDMAKVFEEYVKFKNFREGLQKELQGREGELRQLAEQIQAAQKDLQTADKSAPNYGALENRLITLNADAKTKQATIQREFLRKESQMYKEIYLEVQAMIGQAAQFYKYNMVIRFRRDGVNEEADPQRIMQGMNQLVLYHDEADDLTDRVIKVLNQRYTAQAAAGGGNRN
ncbi:MAG: OmpH family outer membrane protein [Planctomycetota bacterium]